MRKEKGRGLERETMRLRRRSLRRMRPLGDWDRRFWRSESSSDDGSAERVATGRVVAMRATRRR